jgi:hypothetical protein
MPEVKVSWYDGGIYPQRPANLPDGIAMLNDDMGGILFVGSKDTLICDLAGVNPRLLSGRVPNVPKTLRRIDGYKYGGIDDFPHAQDWIRACKESPENRIEAACNFDYAGPFNEMIVMGVVGVRLQPLNRILKWDGENMRFTNINDNDNFKFNESSFSVQKGHPSFDNKIMEYNPKQFVAELIKHTYRDGWSLPEMP